MVTVKQLHHSQQYELTKGKLHRRRTDITMAKRKSTKGQTTIYKTYI
jgi:hypothetical protein